MPYPVNIALIGRLPCICGRENECEAIRQITQSGNRHQNAESLGEIIRPEKQISIHQTCKAKKYQVNAKAVVMQLERNFH